MTRTRSKPTTVRRPGSAEIAFRSFWRTASRLRRLAEVRFAESGLSPSQWRVLRALHDHEAMGDRAVRATDLCAELLLTKATVSGLVERLVRMGLASRTLAEADQRSRYVSLTAEGRGLVASILLDHPAWMRGLMAGLTAAEQRHLSSVLEKLSESLDPMVRKIGGIGMISPAGPSARTMNGKSRRTHE